MKKNKGFTLIELLAVIVILGLLAVIIIPKMNKTIKDSKRRSYDVSVNNLVKSLNGLAIDKKANLIPFDGCSINFANDVNTCDGLNLNGEMPDSGFISVDGDGNVFGSVKYGSNIFEVRNKEITYMNNGIEYVFDYTGEEQVFSVLTDGYYKLETWGAQGGSYSETRIGGYGGYSSGVVRLTSGSFIFINVGGQGASSLNNVGCVGSPGGFCSGGYNGGGKSAYANSERWGAGGGATHIALSSGTLASFDTNENGVADSNEINNILIVAGGGGGAYSAWDGGSAGGYIGNSGYLRDGYTQSIGGSQVSGGTGSTSGSFGLGGSMTGNNGTGGGAGFYGAGSGVASSAGGGSSYIGNPLLTNKSMYCYNCAESNSTSTKTISVNDESKVTEEPISGYPKKGNGFAKITYLGESID